MFVLAGSVRVLGSRAFIVGGLIAAVVLIGAYFITELVHYRILSNQLINDAAEWRSESWIVISGVIPALIDIR